jgi:phosphoribosylanthranilate isomerase
VKPTRIKFCGITREADADAAVAAGADAIGLVLAPGSPRFIAPERAAMIRGRLPPFVQAVTVFRNADATTVRDAVARVRPDLLQFHGEETPEFCASFALPYLRAVPMKHGADLAQWAARYAGATALLLDSHGAGERGGQGKAFDWSTVPAVTVPLVLAGGLTPDNVFDAVRRVRPCAVDVATGVERAPGIKDASKLQRFAEEVRRADAA